MPADVVADNFPVVACIALARIIAVGGYFLIAAERAREDVRVEVFVGGHVRESDYVSAFDLLSPLANFSCLSFDHPVRVDLENQSSELVSRNYPAIYIIARLDASDRLLATSSSVLHVMGMQSTPVVHVEQLNYTATCHETRFGGWN